MTIDGGRIAERRWRIIQRNATSITIYRDSSTLAAQTVRITRDDDMRRQDGERGRMVERDCVVHGIRQHPTVADTDIEVNDRFAIGETGYEVFAIAELPGGVQALCVEVDG